MSSHNGWGATRGGRLPRSRETFAVPRVSRNLVTMLEMAQEVRRIAAELQMPAREVLLRMRADGVMDADDETLERIVALAHT